MSVLTLNLAGCEINVSKFFTGLKSEYLMQVEWEKTSLQEFDITATDLSTECLIDLLTRIPNLK